MPTGENALREPVLKVTDLETKFHTRDGAVHAVNGVSFDIAEGELLGVVGESGSGKSVTMMSLMGLLPSPPAEVTGGEVLFQGRDVRAMDKREMRRLRGGEIGFVFQDPMTSLNPVFTVGFQLMEPLREHMGLSKREARVRAAELLALVGIPTPKDRLNDYPHQFSGGMRQRVMIAIALACDPKVLIADEPTTALDVTIQAQILELVKELREKLGMAIVWITHDLGVVAGIADRVMVMYGGLVVEHATVVELFSNPQHPYTRALMQTLPAISGERSEKLRSISGQPPTLNATPTSCPFAPRCGHAHARCRKENPVISQRGPGHDVACFWTPDEAEEATNAA
jgi:oligopeptide/dipeptide ABC transporter ATP-binding protein